MTEAEENNLQTNMTDNLTTTSHVTTVKMITTLSPSEMYFDLDTDYDNDSLNINNSSFMPPLNERSKRYVINDEKDRLLQSSLSCAM